LNLCSSLEELSISHPEKTAIIAGSTRISYGDLLDKVNRLAGNLSRLGLKKGDRLAFLMPNCPEFVISFYAAMKLGVITVSLNVMFKKDEVDFIANDAEPVALIAHENLLPLVSDMDRVRKGRMRVILVGGRDTPEKDMRSFQSLFEEAPVQKPTGVVAPEDEAVIAYTSGTTGFPKGAVHTHQNILAHLQGICNHLGFHSGDVVLAALPFSQLVAFLIHAGVTLHVGGTVVILEKFETANFLNAVRKEHVTFFAGVPTIYHMIRAASKDLDVDLRSLRFGLCAGSPLSLELREQFENKFRFRIIHCYGMTEISLIAACEDPTCPPKGISVGHVLPYIRLNVVRADGSRAEKGEVGEIHIGAERTLNRYWNAPSETEETIRDGWFATGDMGRFDEQDHLYIVDRKKDMIIRGGFNIYPAEIERVLAQDPRVQEVAVIGVPHERLGELPKAFVVLKDGATATKKELLELSREKLANFKALEEVEFVHQGFFHRNALGKIVKSELRAALKRAGGT